MNTTQPTELMSPESIIHALRTGDQSRIRMRFMLLDPLVAAYLSAMTTDQLQGEERIDFMQLLGES